MSTAISLPSKPEIARALSGKVRPRGNVEFAGPGRAVSDLSCSLLLDPDAPDGFVVVDAKNKIDPIVLKDFVRSKLGIPFRPRHKNGTPHNGAIGNDVREPVLRNGRNGGEDWVERPRPHQPLTVHDAAELLATSPPPREWHVENGWVPADDITLLGADGGEGKTTLALQLAYCTAWGFPWLGNSVRGGAAIYFTAEESISEMHFRLTALRRAIVLEGAPPHPLKIVSCADRDAVLANPGPGGSMIPTPLFHRLVKLVREIEAKLLVLDAVADVFGGNEIERWQVRSFFRLLRGQVAIPHSCAVLLNAHPSVDGMKSNRGYSGSTHWNNSARCRHYLTTPKRGDSEPDLDLRELERQKSNRSRRGVKLTLRWGDGAFTAQAGDTASVLDLAKAKQVFLQLLRRYTSQGRNLSDKKGPSYAPKLLEAETASEGLSSELLAKAMNELFAEGRLKVESYGRPSRPYSRLVEVQNGGAE